MELNVIPDITFVLYASSEERFNRIVSQFYDVDKKILEEARKKEFIDINSPCYVDNIIRYSM